MNDESPNELFQLLSPRLWSSKRMPTKNTKIVYLFRMLPEIAIVAWSLVCAWWVPKMLKKVVVENDLRWKRFFEVMDELSTSMVFLLTYLCIFNLRNCYDRWWEAREVFSNIMTETLEFTQMCNSYIRDPESLERLNRYTIFYVYACKSFLLGSSASKNDKEYLLENDILNQEEMESLKENPSWEPHFCLHAIRVLITDVFSRGGDALTLDDGKLVFNAQIFRSFDNSISKLHQATGTSIRLKKGGLPITIVIFQYFLCIVVSAVLPIPGAAVMGWALPIFNCILALCFYAMILIGEDLIDPYVSSVCGLPLGLYCKTTEDILKNYANSSKNATAQKHPRS